MFKVATPPASEPVTRDEAKLHLRVDSTDEDALIDGMIAAARQRVEEYTCRSLITQSLELYLDCFPFSSRSRALPVEQSKSEPYSEILLPRLPVASVTQISYADPDTGVMTVLASTEYRVDLVSKPPRVTPEYDKSWPVTRDVTNAVKIEYVAGYGNAAAVPEVYKIAMKLLLTELYENRSKPNLKVANSLLGPHRVKMYA